MSGSTNSHAGPPSALRSSQLPFAERCRESQKLHLPLHHLPQPPDNRLKLNRPRRIRLEQRLAPERFGALRQFDQFGDVGGARVAGEALVEAGAVAGRRGFRRGPDLGGVFDAGATCLMPTTQALSGRSRGARRPARGRAYSGALAGSAVQRIRERLMPTE